MCDRLEAQAKGARTQSPTDMDLNKEAQEWYDKSARYNEDEFPQTQHGDLLMLEAFARHILSKQPPSPGLSVDEVMDAMDHVGHMPDNSDHSYLWEEKFLARLNELAENKR